MKEKGLKVWLQRVGREKAGTVSVPQGLWQTQACQVLFVLSAGSSLPRSSHGPPAHVALPRTRQSTGSALLCGYTRGGAALRDHLVEETGWHKTGVGATATAAGAVYGPRTRRERNPRFGACAAQGRAYLQTPVRRHWDEDILLYCLPPDWHEQWLTRKKLGGFLSHTVQL